PNRPQQEALLREPNDVQPPRPGGSPACCASRLDPSHPTTSRKGQQPSSKCQNGSPDRSVCSPNRPQQEAQYARAIPVKTIPSGSVASARGATHASLDDKPLASPGLTSKPGYPVRRLARAPLAR